jgi:transposase
VNVGFLSSSIRAEQLNAVSRRITDMYQHKPSLFELNDSVVEELVTKLWSVIVKGNKLDLTLHDPSSRKVDADSLKHTNVREVGAEWICYNTWLELGLDTALEELGFTEEEIKLAQTQVISRAIYPYSELASAKWIRENSAITEITGFDTDKINKDRLYRGALKLNAVQPQLQTHLSHKTNELFDIQDKVVLYDLTNTYFEGEKRNSKLAQFGRSKEKRNDAKLVVLALVVNMYGFIKYSSIHEGNLTDSKSLIQIIDQLDSATKTRRPLVVIDAGIATEDNLKLLVQKGYNYLCVSRSKPKEIVYDTNRSTTLYTTPNKSELTLKTIKSSNLDGYLLEVHSNKKQLTEASMRAQFASRYEQELQKIKTAVSKKGGVQKTEKVYERIGRAKQKYPSVHALFDIKIEENKTKNIITDIAWKRNEVNETIQNNQIGKYYLRTNLPFSEEVVVWQAYNTIREIESTFRVLKTDLDLRPIYHKKDESTIAHLNLGLLAYWLVNTIRQKLKRQDWKHDWKEIVRIAQTQKVITTTGTNTAGKLIIVRKCSEPEQELRKIQAKLNIKPRAFTKLKSVVHKPERVSPQTYIQPTFGP